MALSHVTSLGVGSHHLCPASLWGVVANPGTSQCRTKLHQHPHFKMQRVIAAGINPLSSKERYRIEQGNGKVLSCSCCKCLKCIRLNYLGSMTRVWQNLAVLINGFYSAVRIQWVCWQDRGMTDQPPLTSCVDAFTVVKHTFKNLYLGMCTKLEAFHRCSDLYLNYKFPSVRHTI